jgi:beta-lactamase superfamily II metal-dependent hydrolase
MFSGSRNHGRHRSSPGELFFETNDNSVAILLTYGSARILLAGDAEAREEEYMANGSYTGFLTVSNPDADHIGGFLDVFDAFEVGVVYISGDPKGTLSYNSFVRGVREEGSKVEVVRAGRRLDWGSVQAARESRNTQPIGLRFRAVPGEEPKVELGLL